MGHLSAKSGYDQLVERLNKFPQGAPPSDTLYKLLGILFDETEAALVSKLPIQAFKADEAAKRWKMPIDEATVVLDRLARRAILVDIHKNDDTYYILPPPMAGFIEFSMMRIREDIDQHSLGQLLYQYMNVEEDFIRELFFGTETKMVRAFINEPTLPKDDTLEIMDYERATEVIKTAEHIGIGVCYCRHKMEHVGLNCDAPMEICMTFGNTADSLIRSNYARRASREECLELLETAYTHNLVQVGENVQDSVAFICNCCGCCCEALLAAKKFGTSHTISTTQYLPEIDQSQCIECGKCINVCPMDALVKGDVSLSGEKIKLIEDMCLGCGVCARNCKFDALHMKARDKRIITPVNTAHRVVLTAIDKGQLANLFFDNEDLVSHRILGAIVSAIVALPPAKQLLANEQIRSKYLAKIIGKR